LPFLKRHILSLALLAQAGLLCFHIDLLPIWGDERYTLETARLPPARILEALRVDVHPPLYYFLVKGWLKLPLPGAELARARELSLLFALLATVAVYRLWLANIRFRDRCLFLGLWVGSPFLLLYARMARSYTLQLLLAVIAIRTARDWLRSPRNARATARYIFAAVALLYTHYLPGLAVVTGTALVGLCRRQWRQLLALPAIALAYAPWLRTLIETSGMVARGQPYQVSGNVLIAAAVRVAYTFTAFNFGESIPPWGILLAAGVSPALLWALWKAWRRTDRVPLLFLAVAGIAYFGASAWVTFAFLGARLLFLLPFYYLFLLRGLDTRRIAGLAAYAALVIVACGGLGSYYRKRDFLNKGYLVDYAAIAGRVAARSRGEPALVLLDSHVSDAGYALHEAGFRGRVEILNDAKNFDQALAEIRHHHPSLVWYIRYGRDLTPAGLHHHLEAEVSREYTVERHGAVPFSWIDRKAMQWLRMAEQPAYLVEVLEMRPRGPQERGKRSLERGYPSTGAWKGPLHLISNAPKSPPGPCGCEPGEI